MDSDQLRELYERYFYYILFADIGIGLLFGAVPLVFGIRRKKRNLGIIGFVTAGIVGVFSPILSIVVAVVFTVLILRKSAAEKELDSDGTVDTDISE